MTLPLPQQREMPTVVGVSQPSPPFLSFPSAFRQKVENKRLLSSLIRVPVKPGLSQPPPPPPHSITRFSASRRGIPPRSNVLRLFRRSGGSRTGAAWLPRRGAALWTTAAVPAASSGRYFGSLKENLQDRPRDNLDTGRMGGEADRGSRPTHGG